MRIAIFHNLPSGGAKRAVYEWTRRLAQGHSIDVFSLSSSDHEFCDIRPFGHHLIYSFAPRRLFESPFGRLNQLQRWRDLRDLTALSRRIAKEIDESGYDVLFAHTCMYTFMPACLQFTRTRSVYYLHEPFGRAVEPPSRAAAPGQPWRAVLDSVDPGIKLYRGALDRLQRASISGVTRLLANSEFTRQSMKSGFGVDAAVCRLGVNCESFRPLPGVLKGGHVLSVGELSPRKGFEFLVRSIARIDLRSRPPLRLACNSILNGEEAKLRSLARELGVELTIMSKLNTEQLCLEYNAARLCVYAPISEPFGLVPLEAMACGTPVLAVAEGGVAESIIAGETGMATHRDPSVFAGALAFLLNNESLASELGRRGREHALAKWTWEESGNALERHLFECANGMSSAEETGVSRNMAPA